MIRQQGRGKSRGGEGGGDAGGELLDNNKGAKNVHRRQ